MREIYKRFLKEAKSKKIKNIEDLERLSLDYEDLTGGEFECAKNQLKIKRF